MSKLQKTYIAWDNSLDISRQVKRKARIERFKHNILALACLCTIFATIAIFNAIQ